MRKLKGQALQFWDGFSKKRKPRARVIDVTEASKAAASRPPAYREFDPADPDAMWAWTEKAFGEWGKSLTRHERTAIDRYSSHAYRKVNKLLRGDSEDLTSRAKRDYRRVTARMDAAIEKGEIPENIVVWRGMSAKRLPGDLAEGTILSDKAFSSTSLSRTVAEDSDFAKGAVLKIRVPKGTHAASAQVAADFGREFELILPRNGRIKVTSVTSDADGRRLIEGDWLPHEAKGEAGAIESPKPQPEAPRPKARPPVVPPVAARPNIGQPRADLSVKAKVKPKAVGQPRTSPVPSVKIPGVVYLKAGQKPKPLSKSIQVYEE
jgi:hypothetical protein